MSQAALAEAIRSTGLAIGAPNQCSKRLVQKWETGEHASCSFEYLRVLQVVTGLSTRELGFQTPRYGPEPSSGPAVQGAIDGFPDGIAAGGAPVAIPAHYSRATLDDSMSRLRSLANSPALIDVRAADLAEASTSRLFDMQHHTASKLLAPTVERHLATMTGLLTAARHESVRQRLMVCSGSSAMLAGWLAFDRGDNEAANKLWDDAISTAESTMKPGLLAAVLTRQSYAAARRGDPHSAWQLAHDASTLTPDDPRATAWATARAALYAAQLGERAAAEDAMKGSLDLGHGLPNPTPIDGGAPWTRFFDNARLLACAAHTAALLKDPNAADYATQAVDALSPAKVKSRAVVLAEAALAAAIAGELTLCIDYGSLAVPLARDMTVSVATDLLHDLVPLVTAYPDVPESRELLQQVTRLKRATDMQDEAEKDR